MYEVVLHVGLPRSASTFLQNNIFSNCPNINYIDRRSLGKKIIDDDGICFYDKYFFKLDSDKINLISDECICQPVDRKDILLSLKEIYDVKKVLFIERDFYSLMQSYYKYHLLKGGNQDYLSFYRSHLIDLDIGTYIGFLNNNFDEVCVLDFNLLKDDFVLFLNRLSVFLDVDLSDVENVVVNSSGSKDFNLSLLRLVNCFFKNSVHNPNGWGFIPDKYNYYRRYVKWRKIA